jgi:hypothetical protein
MDSIKSTTPSFDHPAASAEKWPGLARSRMCLIGFVLAAALSALVFTFMHLGHQRHDSPVYVLLLYLVVLPSMLLYWRNSRRSGPATWLLPRVDLAATCVFAVLAVAVAASGAHEHTIADESAYKFQARVFAAGKLKAEPMPGVAEKLRDTPREIYFEQTIQTRHGWFSKYPPGWPAVLAIGYLLHCGWLLNPIFGLVQVLLIWQLAQPFGRTTQVVAIFVAATSAYMLLNDAGFMSHALNAVLWLSAIASLLRGTRTKQLRYIILSFLLVVFATTVRPYTGAVFALLSTAITLYELRKDPSLLLKSAGIVLAAAASAIGVFLITNHVFTGNALVSPYALMHGGMRIHELTVSPGEILYNLLHLWRWAITDTVRVMFPFMLLFAIYALYRERSRRELWYFALLFPSLIFACLFQAEASASFDGERFYFEGFCPMAIVAGRGLYLWCNDWRLARPAIVRTLFVLTGLQGAMVILAIADVETVLTPFKQAWVLAQSAPNQALVFLSGDSPAFWSKHVNWNEADWSHARTVYLNDPGSAGRDRVACEFGRPSYRVVKFDEMTHTFSKHDMVAKCHNSVRF